MAQAAKASARVSGAATAGEGRALIADEITAGPAYRKAWTPLSQWPELAMGGKGT